MTTTHDGGLDPAQVNVACAGGDHDGCPGKVIDGSPDNPNPVRHYAPCACCAAGHPAA